MKFARLLTIEFNILFLFFYPLPMQSLHPTRLTTLTVLLMLSAPAAHAYAYRSAALQYAGVSDEYLVSIGTQNATRLLTSSLLVSKNEPHFRGIMQHLNEIHAESHFDESTTRSLIKFLENNISRRTEIGDTDLVLSTALRSLGKHGTGSGINYLIRWVDDPSYVKKVTYRHLGDRPDQVRLSLIRSVLLGLGYSGNADSLVALEHFKTNIPPEFDNMLIRKITDRMIVVNKLISKEGQSAYFKNPSE